ncbi:MAG: ATP-binding cassette domain-containing protein [Pseudomonadota bacterium]
MNHIRLDRAGRGGERAFHLHVDDIAFEAGPGRANRVPIMGPSGAGKSTLMNLLAGVVWPPNPEAIVKWRFPDGETCEWGHRGPAPERLVAMRRRYFGYAFQTATLQPHLTIGENLTYRLQVRGLPRPKALALAEESLADVFDGDRAGARRLLSRFDTEVSGGEKQRISLVQAFIHDPAVLFADEPTGSLDHRTRGEVMAVLHRWLEQRRDDRLLIWVTHHENDPADNGAASRLYVSDGGCRWQRMADGQGWREVA